ncbi:hypothetical protein EIP91_003474 [Steccherinum ochraceum]|uniref:NADP-dependent oxidoreductase domain-containing protein n=1 Tax=Steccherinum ochraceum TaxID=92696 RepID=A0A4R0RM39_9APHY|nr:hypothetical protein EIP91_003474 [Steccherinum ochraceum]
MVPTFKLNDGHSIPAIGIGCFIGKPGGGDQVREMVEHALKIGYRHIDTAFMYENEQYVGQAIRNSGVPREELYVVTKLFGTYHGNVEEGLDKSLKALGLDYVDLYLMHWPQGYDPATGRPLGSNEHPTFVDTWKAMEKLPATGKVRSIGISNFSVKNLDVLLPQVTTVPAVNQVWSSFHVQISSMILSRVLLKMEINPFYPQPAVREYCKKKGIHITAYSTFGLGNADLLSHPVLQTIAARTGYTTAQVITGWVIKKGYSSIPRSFNHDRLAQNLKYAEITSEDEAKIDVMYKAPGVHRTSWGHFCADGMILGWTYEQLGFNIRDGGSVIED